jgi:hypothetical protein
MFGCAADLGTGRAMRLHRPGLRTTLAVVAAVLASALIGACSDDSNRTQPAANGAALLSGQFAGIPRYPDSKPAGSTTHQGGTTTRSFEVQANRPMDVLGWYRKELASRNWTVVEAPHQLGQGDQAAARGTWQHGSSTLVISSEVAPGLSNGEQALQFSLVLTTA